MRELVSPWEDLTLNSKTLVQKKTLTTDEEVQELAAKRAETK